MTTPSSRSLAVLCALVAGVAGLSRRPVQAQEVTTSDLETAAGDTSSWLMYGRDYNGHRFVELDEITPENVDRLHPAWVFATGGENRGLEATPLVHDGVIYLSADESRVFAIDARTGAKKWGFEPEMSDAVERVYCCGSNNRGVALFGELVYVGTMDARLIALHRETGAVAWGDRGRRLAAGLQHHRRPAGGGRPGAHRRAALDDVHHPRSRRARQRLQAPSARCRPEHHSYWTSGPTRSLRARTRSSGSNAKGTERLSGSQRSRWVCTWR